MKNSASAAILAVVTAVSGSFAVADDDPWVITTPVVITEPTELGHVILLSGGSLTVRGVPEPGLEMRGHIWATGSSSVILENSVIRFLSVYHGQYSLVAADTARVEVTGCDYRIPSGVQHALFAVGQAEMTIADTDFGDVQLVSSATSSVDARRLTGHFEVIVQDDSEMRLADIPRPGGEGSIWVWVEFPDGAEAVYSPPLPGFVESWSFPPPDATGIRQKVSVDRCETLLWPMLVRAGSDVTLRDIPDEHWVVVGFHLPYDAVIENLVNDSLYPDVTLDLADRSFRLVNASVDTWNLYPQADARVTIRDSVIGEVLSMQDSRVVMQRVTVDGTGGFFGARDTSAMTAEGCRFTCTVEATQEATVVLRSSTVEPYPADPTGAWTRFGAYDDGRLLADQTAIGTTPALAGRGLIAVSYLHEPPTAPPGPGGSIALVGSIAQFSLDPEVAAGRWRVTASDPSGAVVEIAAGTDNVEDDLIGVWNDGASNVDHRLQSVLVDGLGRTLVGNLVVPGSDSRSR